MDSTNRSRDENIISFVNSQHGIGFSSQLNDRFIQAKNLLIGFIHATYMDKKTFKIKIIKTIGILVDSYIVLILKHKFTQEIYTNPTLKIRYTSIDSKYKKEFSFSLSLEKIISNLFDNQENPNPSNLLFRNNTNIWENIYSKWALVILQNPLGEYLLNFDGLESKYFAISENMISKRAKIYFSSVIYIESKDEVESITTAMDNKILFFDKNKFYLIFPSNSKFLFNDGIVYSKSFQIIGIYEGGKSKILDSHSIKKSISEKENNSAILNDLNKLLKSFLSNNKESELRFLEVEFLNETDNKDLMLSLEKLRRIFFPEVGSLSFQVDYYSNFKEYFNSYDRLLNLFVAGPLIFNRLCQNLQLNVKTLDKNYLVKKIINDDINEKYNIESLEILGFHLDDLHFSSVLESFYFSKNLINVNLSGNLINLEKSVALSNFLFQNKQIKKINLSNTGMGTVELFLVVQGLIQGNNNSISLLNLSDNDFYKNNNQVPDYYNYEFPSDLSFLSILFEINSLRDLFLYNLNFENKNIIDLFTSINKRLVKENEEIEKKNENLEEKDKQIMLSKYISLKGIRILNISKNLIRKDSMDVIGNYILQSNTLEEIYFSECNLDDNCVGILSDYAIKKSLKYDSGSNFIKILDLSGNKITWKGAEKLKEYLKAISHHSYYAKEKESIIDGFDTKNFNLDFKTLKSPKNNLLNDCKDSSVNSKQFTLILDNNLLFSEGVAKICEGISSTTPDLNLSLKNVNLKSIDMEAIYNVLVCNLPIKYLSLAGNSLIDDDILEYYNISKTLCNPKCSLHVLDLHFTKVTINGVFNLLSNFSKTSTNKLKIICDPFNLKNISNNSDKSFYLLDIKDKSHSFKKLQNIKTYEFLFKYVQFYKKI